MNLSKTNVSKQSQKITEIGQALRAAGIMTLTAQAQALGVSRSTAWTIVNARQHRSGLNACTINRILKNSELPTSVRRVIYEYVEQKRAGEFGHGTEAIRRFKRVV